MNIANAHAILFNAEALRTMPKPLDDPTHTERSLADMAVHVARMEEILAQVLNKAGVENNLWKHTRVGEVLNAGAVYQWLPSSHAFTKFCAERMDPNARPAYWTRPADD